jgi:hypothetical protein
VAQTLAVHSETERQTGHDDLLIGVEVVSLIQSCPTPNALAKVDHLEADP